MIARYGFKKLMRKKDGNAVFLLQLTSMVDMFTIILVFLLKSYSTSAVKVSPSDNIKLPFSASTESPVEGLKLAISSNGIFVDDELVLKVIDGKLPADSFEASDKKFLKALFQVLEKKVAAARDIEKINSEFKFEGKAVVQIHKKINYSLVKKVMYTSAIAGFADFKLATVNE